MLLTKEAQYAWVQEYAKTHTYDETFAFIDGIDKVIQAFEKEQCKEINWISITEELPPRGINVDLYGENWQSTGWLTESGLWSIEQSKNVTILSKPTHWSEIKK